jgi:hypothetical protein
MQRKASASRPKQALVRFLNASRQPIGTGCLTANGLIVTSAHVVRAALGLTKEQAIGARPRGVLTFDFPFLDSDSVPPQPANASEKTYQAEVAPGGWGWMKDGAHGNDIAILKLIGDAPFVHGRMFAEAHATDHDLVVWLQGFPTDDTDAGKIDATLKAHGELPDGRLTLDFEDSLYILNPGCSGAPVFRPDGHAAIGIFIGRPHHLEKAHRDRNRIAYAVPASRINALLDAVTNAQAAEAAPEEIARIRSLIPSLQNHLQKVVQEANDPRILRGLSVCLDDIDATLEKGFGKSTISDLADYIGEFDGFHHEARTEGLDYRLSLGVFDDTRRSLDDLRRSAVPQKQ